MTAALLVGMLMKRGAQIDPEDPEAPTDPGQEEIFSSWALFILVALLIMALFTSYFLQLKKIQAVHETVVSIFAGMFVGLIIRISPGQYIQNLVTFNSQLFFNLLLPPIILNSGYELHQANFFRNIGTILTFAFAGTFISAVVLGIILYLWSFIHLDGLRITFVEAISVGATLSATDPVTILAIFNTYKVDPKLYTIIFGESILNDAVAIVMFETAQKFHGKGSISSWFKGIGIFFVVFTVSLIIGVLVGIATALLLKHTYIRRFPRIESCLILLVAYASYLFSNGCHFSGIVSLLFCGITLKHYAYYNMSRRTQLTTKYLFQVLAQLSENFIFIYLGISLFTEGQLLFKPLFILVTAFGVCVARWAAVFPLSKLINAVVRYRARRRGRPEVDELPHSYQAMLFWAGLRGAVGVALAASLTGGNAFALQATILVVVVLTVIVFGGTTARMLEILGIRTGVVDDAESDDEFDIDVPNAFYGRPHGEPSNYALNDVGHSSGRRTGIRKQASINLRQQQQGFLGTESRSDSDMDSDSDLPPMRPGARQADYETPSPRLSPGGSGLASRSRSRDPTSRGGNGSGSGTGSGFTASGAISQITGILSGTTDDHAEWFRQFDEEYIKPALLLQPDKHGGPGGA